MTVPFPAASRPFLTGALAHLAAASTLVALGPEVGTFGPRWDLLLWLVLAGFVGATASGFALHLFPTIARRPAPAPGTGTAAFLVSEGGVVVGAVALSGTLGEPAGRSAFVVGALLFLVGEALVFGSLARGLLAPPRGPSAAEGRSGDRVTVPLFLFAWSSAVAAGALFVASGFGPGPGFGWWVAAVHLFVLGHALPLIVAVSLRLLPRSLDTDLPPPLVYLLAGSAPLGAVLVTTGMLAVPVASARTLDLLAVPEGAFGVALAASLLLLMHRGRTHRPEVAIELVSALFLLGGGGVGLAMVYSSSYGRLATHVFLNVFGFTGLTILYMWFGMIAPFQRISHAWTRRMRWSLSIVWAGAVGLAAVATGVMSSADALAVAAAGGILLAAAVAWSVGTLPVLFPSVNPLPGLTSEELRALRDRRRPP